MKINSIYISAFGGLKNVALDFKDGFNLIYGDNENGKTTVMSFIKMMFYGNERGSAKLSKNIRKKYTPWDGSNMAGSVDFKHNGTEYRIEREFRSSNSTDKVTLCDLNLGTRQSAPADLGLSFFGLSSAAFERSVFIGQFGFPENDSAAEGEINAKLSNIVLTGDESISFETVNSRLEKAKLNLMSKSGKKGEYDKNLILCSQLKTRIEKATEKEQENKAKQEKIELLKNETLEILERANLIKERIEKQEDIRNAEKLSEFLSLKSQLDTLNDSLKLEDGTLIDEMYLRKLQFCISKLQSAMQKCEAKASEKEKLEKSIEAGLNPPQDASKDTANALSNELSALQVEKEKISAKLNSLKEDLNGLSLEGKNGKKGSLLLVGGIFSVLSGLVLGILKIFLGAIPLFAIGIALLCLYPVIKNSQKRKNELELKTITEIKAETENLKTKENSLADEIFTKRVRLETINTALNSTASIIKSQQQTLIETNAELEVLKKEEQTEKDALFSLFAKYKEADSLEFIINELEEISKLASSTKEIKQQLSFISKDLGNISYSEAEQKLKETKLSIPDESVDFDEIKGEYELLQSKITDNKSLISSLSAELKFSLQNTENTNDLQTELDTLVKKCNSQKEFCDALDISMQTLLEAFGEIRKSYGSALEKKAGEIFGGLTSQRYDGMNISKTFDITVNDKANFGGKEIDFLSSGTADQAYLSLRLALSELICDQNEPLPLLLDDALAQYDDRRMETALEFLNEYSKQSQIIMFTCHKNICETAKNLDANCMSL